MESIFHEKQEGSLCAQHCLNNLLQGEYFTPVDLSSIAHQLDEEERMRMAEGGMGSDEYRTFLQQPSGNMDDSGFFSIQVISNALSVWGLELVLFNSREYQRLMINPINEKAFICNYKEHWFTIRKLGQQWFNLNSLLTGPELISDTYLALFLAQLQQEGYSIFVIRGNLPDCEAEQILGILKVQQQHRPKLIGEDEAQSSSGIGRSSGHVNVLETAPGVEEGVADEDEEELRKALALSRQDMEVEDEEADLRRAIQLSMQGAVMSNKSMPKDELVPKMPKAGQAPGSTPEEAPQSEKLSAEDLRKRRQAYFDRQSQQQAPPTLNQQPHITGSVKSGPEEDEPAKHSQEVALRLGERRLRIPIQLFQIPLFQRVFGGVACYQSEETRNDLELSWSLQYGGAIWDHWFDKNHDHLLPSLSLGSECNKRHIQGVLREVVLANCQYIQLQLIDGGFGQKSLPIPNIEVLKCPKWGKTMDERLFSTTIAGWKHIFHLKATKKMMKMGIFFLLVIVCIPSPASPTGEKSPNITDLTFKNMDFAMNLYRKIAGHHDDNIFFSPLSISTAFTTLSMAAQGPTRDEILEGLNLAHLDRVNQPDIIPELFQHLQGNISQDGTLKVDQSTALFVHHTFEVESDYSDQIKKFFNAEINNVDFADTKASVSTINDYIMKKTGNRVKEMVSDLDPLTQLMLINTIFYQGKWKTPFNHNLTENGRFYIDNYNIVQVPMMFIMENKFYTTEDISLNAKVLKLPYLNGVSMLILLPDKGLDYTTIDDEITYERFLRWTRNLKERKLEVQLPKFNMEQSYAMHKILPDLGVSRIFHYTANLTRLSKSPGLKVSEVFHKAVIQVDESGTTAAAATESGIVGYALPDSFIINRPFFFFIYHEATNCLLFMGRVIDPTKN
ncbi:hypothetical protein DPEC_G00289990 [Dallia pectoralis]|uniref:Uncharacterized protein n=1 Tax=Dallia pectoralis TaxID=75939 RepID=A0ACC2FH98_DALPE|nr:hypothetical protein DPEC_G00289990 [Dallia pectoralis]